MGVYVVSYLYVFVLPFSDFHLSNKEYFDTQHIKKKKTHTHSDILYTHTHTHTHTQWHTQSDPLWTLTGETQTFQNATLPWPTHSRLSRIFCCTLSQEWLTKFFFSFFLWVPRRGANLVTPPKKKLSAGHRKRKKWV